MSNIVITDTEKAYFKSAGKVFLKFVKVMGFLFVAALVLTAFTAAQSNPHIYQVRLDGGETAVLDSFYASDGRDYQFGFGIERENGVDYQYPEDNEWNWFEYTNQMEWKVQLIVERADDLQFSNPEVVGDYSGESNVIQMTLQQGFYRVKVINHEDSTLDIVVGHASTNMALAAAALGLWVAFGMTVGIFSFAIKVAFWLLVIYFIIKVLTAINEEQKSQPNMTVITPPNQQ